MKQSHLLVALTVLFVLATPFSNVMSADHPVHANSATATVTPETLNAKINEVAATADLDEEIKTKLTELYRKTLSHLETAHSHNAAANAFTQARASAPDKTKHTQEELDRIRTTAPTPTSGVSEQTPLSEVNQLLFTEKANLAAVEAKLADLKQQLASGANRPAIARVRLTEAKQRQQAIADQLKSPAPADEPPALTEARRWLLQTQGSALSAEIKMLDQELLSQPMRFDLLNALRDKTALSVERLTMRVRLLEEMVNQRRRTESEQTKAETEAAKREAMDKDPLVQQLAEQNAALSEELNTVTADLDRVSAGDEAANKKTQRIADNFNSTRKKLQLAGLSEVLGQVLVKQRRSLPDLDQFRKEASSREQLIAETGLRQIRHDEERRRLDSIADYVDGLTTTLPPQHTELIRGDLEALADSRKALLGKAVTIDKAYLRALGELDFAQRQLFDVVADYDQFLAERLLWIRSAPLPNLALVRAIPKQVGWLVSPAHWLEVARIIAARTTRSPLLMIVLTLFAALSWKAKSMHRALQAIGKKVGKPTTDRFAFTLQALGLTLLLALPWPLLLATLGWQMERSLNATEFSTAISKGLLWVALPLLNLSTLRVLCHPGGLAAAHFRWPELSLNRLRRDLNRLMIVFLPATFVAAVILSHDSALLGGGLGRLSFIVMTIALAMFFYRLTEPEQGALHGFTTRNPTGALARLRYFWLALSVAVPLLLGGLSLAGYTYTAATLMEHLIDTLWLIFGLVLAQQLSQRWLLLTRGKLAVQAALERRATAQSSRESKESNQPANERVTIEVEEPETDLAALSQESSKLLNTALGMVSIIGLWVIWSEVLPAFGILDNITLWHHVGVVSGEQQNVPVTLADVGLAVLVAVVTFVAAKRLPALLEIILLKRFSMPEGNRYTITTLSNYVIVAVGIVLFFNILGVDWSRIQWLLAALSVGIGFGLQEIVANFISGIIILFERPIRVGDVVSVGATDGIVTRIRIRATTIRNWERKELLVPNKEFITGRVLNWSLSDQTTRIQLPVGVAYGSDVQKAMALMIEAANQHDGVLAEPMPYAIFQSFGDNSLALELRCFVASIDDRVGTISALHEAIDHKFNDAGIVIAFPQRDLHLDAARPLDIRLHRGGGTLDTGET